MKQLLYKDKQTTEVLITYKKLKRYVRVSHLSITESEVETKRGLPNTAIACSDTRLQEKQTSIKPRRTYQPGVNGVVDLA